MLPVKLSSSMNGLHECEPGLGCTETQTLCSSANGTMSQVCHVFRQPVTRSNTAMILSERSSLIVFLLKEAQLLLSRTTRKVQSAVSISASSSN